MAQPRTWLPRADEIVQFLRQRESQGLDRATIQELFQLQRRAAITLMEQVGVSQERGKPGTVSRTSLLSWVERIAREESCEIERRKNLTQDLERSRVEIQKIEQVLREANRPPAEEFTVPQRILGSYCDTMSPGISITKGEITVREETFEAVLPLVFELLMLLRNDADGVRARFEPDLHLVKRAG